MGEREVKNGIGDAIADIRSKLIEEGWFGRRGNSAAATPDLGWELDGSTPRTMEDLRATLSFEEAWATRDEVIDKLDPDYDLGIDR